MTHWIEEAEKYKSRRELKREYVHNRISQKKGDVGKNWEKNKEAYLAFLVRIENFIERINNLPKETRLEFGRIESKEKKTTLQNHLIKFTSSRRRIVRKFDGLFAPFKAKHFKNTRNILLSLSRETDLITLETKEIFAPRIRLDDTEENRFLMFWRFFKRKEKALIHRAKTHKKVEELTDELAMYLIDFLAFKNDGKEQFFNNNANSPSENQ